VTFSVSLVLQFMVEVFRTRRPKRGASPFYLLLLISEKGLRLVRSWGKKTYAPARSNGVVGGYYVLHVLQQAWQNRIGRLAAHNKLLVKLSRTSSIKV
jgi:hypothetical protein